jgi:dTDP-4-amino-4,6-dideoxygalactose transaminase
MNVTLAEWKPTSKQISLVNQVLKSGRLTYGPMHQQFEAEFAKKHNLKHAIFTNSGTSALHVMIQYLKEVNGWKDGDEIIVPAVTFVATVNVILHNRLKPVLVDIDYRDFNIDPELIELEITKKTKAILCVDLLGQPCQIDRIKKVAKKYNLLVLEDSCETMFVNYKGNPVGSQADVVCYSSYLAHIISTGVGGFICTNNTKWADDMRSMIWHGRDNNYLNIDDNKKDKKTLLHTRFKFNRSGHSSRLTELEAALGLDEVRRSDQIIKKRQENAAYLTAKLEKLNLNITLPFIRKGAESAWMFYPIKVEPDLRDDLALYLEERGIQTRWIMPLTNQPVYKGWLKEKDYPNAQYINQSGILLGIHHFLTKKELDYLVKTIKEYYAQA